MSIIDCGIEITYSELIYYAQAGMFAIPPLEHGQLASLLGASFGIPRIDFSIYKCEPIVGKLYTIDDGEAQDWVLV